MSPKMMGSQFMGFRCSLRRLSHRCKMLLTVLFLSLALSLFLFRTLPIGGGDLDSTFGVGEKTVGDLAHEHPSLQRFVHTLTGDLDDEDVEPGMPHTSLFQKALDNSSDPAELALPDDTTPSERSGEEMDVEEHWLPEDSVREQLHRMRRHTVTSKYIEDIELESELQETQEELKVAQPAIMQEHHGISEFQQFEQPETLPEWGAEQKTKFQHTVQSDEHGLQHWETADYFTPLEVEFQSPSQNEELMPPHNREEVYEEDADKIYEQKNIIPSESRWDSLDDRLRMSRNDPLESERQQPDQRELSLAQHGNRRRHFQHQEPSRESHLRSPEGRRHFSRNIQQAPIKTKYRQPGPQERRFERELPSMRPQDLRRPQDLPRLPPGVNPRRYQQVEL